MDDAFLDGIHRVVEEEEKHNIIIAPGLIIFVFRRKIDSGNCFSIRCRRRETPVSTLSASASNHGWEAQERRLTDKRNACLFFIDLLMTCIPRIRINVATSNSYSNELFWTIFTAIFLIE